MVGKKTTNNTVSPTKDEKKVKMSKTITPCQSQRKHFFKKMKQQEQKHPASIKERQRWCNQQNIYHRRREKTFQKCICKRDTSRCQKRWIIRYQRRVWYLSKISFDEIDNPLLTLPIMSNIIFYKPNSIPPWKEQTNTQAWDNLKCCSNLAKRSGSNWVRMDYDIFTQKHSHLVSPSVLALVVLCTKSSMEQLRRWSDVC